MPEPSKGEEYYREREAEFSRLVAQAKDFNEALKKGFLSGREWLAEAFAEFVETRDLELECWLVTKPNPSWTAAEAVRDVRSKHRAAVHRLKLLEYQLASYEEYFPELIEYRDAILDESVQLSGRGFVDFDESEPALAHGYLSKDEYDELSPIEKFQRALDRYWEREKSQWEIGRLYEQYIGYKYETEGWAVCYQGILKGLEDFGRDLICKKGGDTHVVQCKCWSARKVIREKHVLQLYGTTVMYRIEQKGEQGVLFESENVTPVLITTTELSPEANAVARELKIDTRIESLARFPVIKCKRHGDGEENIYHLPFDQQYHRIVMQPGQGDCYANTIADAEAAGFRRAYRWRGIKS